MSKKPLMFGFITHTDNPLGGRCYDCEYCYIHGNKGMIHRFEHLFDKYTGPFKLYPHILDKRYKDDSFVFFCDCIDYLHEDVPSHMIYSIFEWIERVRTHSLVNFLSLTKNPVRYLEFKNDLPMMYLGCTIESNRDYPELSQAPNQHERFVNMTFIKEDDVIHHLPRVICIEPILKFDLTAFSHLIKMVIRPDIYSKDFVVIGYDNHNYHLPEPKLKETKALIYQLQRSGIQVIRKTIRKAWDE